MGTYLLQASYGPEAVKGIVKEGGSKRRATIQKMVESAGGRLVAFYFAFGKADVYAIAEMPDHATAMALSMAVNATGMVQLHTTVLISPEEVDAAGKKQVVYRAPGT